MQDFMAARGRIIIRTIAVITLILGLGLYVKSQLYLLLAVIGGYLTAMYYVFMLAARLQKTILYLPNKAKQKAWMGTIMRFTMLLLVLLLAVKLSITIFFAVVIGFFIMDIIVFINIIIFSYNKKT
ncbi:hypothetical protein [Pectinatus frisingensis]|uniref:hypothetical protein n=1 Tax=Pectinatus frisingensis TaxID=865 RepID=UPI0018C5F8FC|nr:hypothetical protein [Pectinatus frisingensis]